MRLIIQRVDQASVSVEESVIGQISKGLFVLVGVGEDDSEKDAVKLADKLVKMRLMPDAGGKMNLDIKQSGGAILVVSQFTLYADTHKGNRPSFIKAADPKQAKFLYEVFVDALESKNLLVQTGIFGSYMKISAVLDGPVTILMSIDAHENK